MGHATVLRLGCPHPGRGRGTLQPDRLSRGDGLAVRQLVHRLGLAPLRLQRGGRPDRRGDPGGSRILRRASSRGFRRLPRDRLTKYPGAVPDCVQPPSVVDRGAAPSPAHHARASSRSARTSSSTPRCLCRSARSTSRHPWPVGTGRRFRQTPARNHPNPSAPGCPLAVQIGPGARFVFGGTPSSFVSAEFASGSASPSCAPRETRAPMSTSGCCVSASSSAAMQCSTWPLTAAIRLSLVAVDVSDAAPMTARLLAQGHAGLPANLEAVRTEDATDSAWALVNGPEKLPAIVAPPGKDPASMAGAVSTTPFISIAWRAQ